MSTDLSFKDSTSLLTLGWFATIVRAGQELAGAAAVSHSLLGLGDKFFFDNSFIYISKYFVMSYFKYILLAVDYWILSCLSPIFNCDSYLLCLVRCIFQLINIHP